MAMSANLEWIDQYKFPESGVVPEYGKIDIRLGKKYNLMNMSKENKIVLLKKIWKEKMGTVLDLENPRTFNEKMQWMKVYDDSTDKLRCEDKVLLRAYIEEKLGRGYMTRILKLWDHPQKILFDGLPNQFVVKSNAQGNGDYVVIVKNASTYDFATLSQEIEDYWFNPLNLYVNGFSETDKKIVPKVFVEEYIEEFSGQVNDYKFWCFGGVPKFLNTNTNHFVNPASYPIGYYDLNWNLLDLAFEGHKVYQNAPKPKHFDEMVDIAKRLSTGFPFVRVDFFDTDEQLYVAELTFEPNSGFGKYNRPEFDVRLGELVVLPDKKQITGG